MRLKHLLSVFLTLLTLSVGNVWGAGSETLGTWNFTNGTTMPTGASQSGGAAFATTRYCFDGANDNIVITPTIPNTATTLYVVVKGLTNGASSKVSTITISGLNSSNNVVSGASGSYTTSYGSASNVSQVDNNTKNEEEISFSATNVAKIKIACTTYGGSKYIVRSVTITYDEGASCSTPPTVGTNLTSVSATTNSITATVPISDIGGCNITENGLVYSTSVATPTVGAANCTKVTATACGGTAANKTITINNLSCGTTYYVRGYAINDGGTSYTNVTTRSTSDCPKYTVTLMDDDTELEQATAGASVNLPSRAGCTGYTFAGWSTTNNTSWTTTAPTIINAGSYTPTANINLYPVYTKTESGGTSYQFQKVTALSQINAGGTFIITNGNYYLPNAQATNAGPSVASMVEVSNGVVTGTVTDAMKWTFSAADEDSHVTIKSAANANYYLYCTNDNNGLRVNNTSDTWTFEEYTVSSVLGFAMKSTTRSRYCAVYQTSNWRTYTTKNQSNYQQNSGRLDLYKYTSVSSSVTSYISVPNCCEPLAQINGSVNASQTSANLTWEAVTGAEKYEYQIQPKGTASADNAWVEATSGVVASNLSCGTEYTAYFRAIDTNGSHCSVGPESSKNFTTSKYSITRSGNPAGTVTGGTFTTKIGNDAVTEACNGSTINIAATPANGYQFSSWSINNGAISPAASAATTTFSMPSANVTVNATFSCVAPVIKIDPVSATYPQAAGTGTALFIMEEVATAAGATLSYQWQSKVGEADWADIEGATNATYAPSKANVGITLYRVKVTSNCGEYAFSGAATIEISSIPVCETPTFGPVAGTYNANQTVTISSATDGATIYYSTDGNDPTIDAQHLYDPENKPVVSSTNTTIKAIAVKAECTNSAVASATYVLKCDAPTFDPAEGAVVNGQEIALSCATTGASIYYSTDGNAPTIDEQHLYDANHKPAISAATTIKAIAVKDNWTNSDLASADYTVKYTVSLVIGGGNGLADATGWTYDDVNKVYTQTQANAGGSITLPDATLSSGLSGAGWNFAGWKTSAVSTQTSDAQEFLDASYTPTNDVTLYAVYKYTESGSATDELDCAFTTVTSTSYIEWNEKNGSESDAVYAGKSTTNNTQSYLQLKGADAVGIISTKSGGNAKKVTVTWNSTQTNTGDNYVLQVYGKNSTYSTTGDLYSAQSATQGTLLGTIAATSQTELTIDGDYAYIGLRGSKNALYFDEIQIDWSTASYSYFSNPSNTVTLTYDANEATAGSAPEAVVYSVGDEATVVAKPEGLAKTGYTFAGWNTKYDGTGTNYVNGTAQQSFTINTNTTLYAKWTVNKHTVAVSSVANGTITATPAGASAIAEGSSNTEVAFGTVVTLAQTNDTHYTFGTWSVMAGETPVDVENNQFTMPDADVTVSATFNENANRTVKYYSNGGDPIASEKVYVGEAPANVPTPEYDECLGTSNMFYGWATAPWNDAIDATALAEKTVYTGALPDIEAGESDVVFHAVWAAGVEGSKFVRMQTLSELESATKIAIVNAYANTHYILKTDLATSSAPSASEGKYTFSDGQYWTLEKSSSNWKFKTGEDYLTVSTIPTSESKSGAIGKATTGDIEWTIANNSNTENGTPVFYISNVANETAGLEISQGNWIVYYATDFNAKYYTLELYVPEKVAGSAFRTTCCTKHNITISNSIEHGTIAVGEDLESACAGTKITLTATGTENAGRFNSWSITGLDSYSTTTNPLTISMPDNNITVSATFDALYAITKVEEGGTINLGANYAAENDVVTISAVAKQDYEEPRELKVYKTNDEGTEISITDGHFTMPGYPVTAKVTYTASKIPLAAPTMGDNSNLTYEGVQLNWTNVEHNSGYALTVKEGDDIVEGYNAKAIDQNATSVVISGLKNNTDYSYSLYAKGDGETYVAVNTAAEGSFKTEDYPTVKLYYSENGTLSAGVDQKIRTNFMLPNTAAECNKTLVGWTTNGSFAGGNVAPDPFMEKNTQWQIPTNAACTLYAVYADVTEGSLSWDATAIGDLGASDVFVIVGNNGDTYAMTNNNGTQNPPAATGVTISESQITSTVAANMQWNISGNSTDGYTFYPNCDNAKWLYCTNTNNGVKVGTGDAKVFTINSGYLYTTQTTNARYVGIYNSQDWRCYENTTGNIAGQTFAFYKKNEVEASTTNYSLTCMGKVAKPSITGVTGGQTYEADQTVTITSATAGATIKYTTDGSDPAESETTMASGSSFTLSDNGTYTIRAIAVKADMTNSDEATPINNVTIDKPFTTIASFIAAAPANKKLVFTGAKVLGVTTHYIYIQDATGAIQLNKSNHGLTFASGKTLSGYIVGTYSNNSSSAYMPRLTFTDGSTMGLTEDAVALPEATVITAGSEANICKLVKLQNVKFQSTALSSNTVYVQKSDLDIDTVYNTFGVLNKTLPNSVTLCDVTGVLIKYSNKYEIAPVSVDGITTNGALAILPTLSPAGSADSENPTAVAEGKEITITPAAGMTSTYKDGEAAAADLTSATNVTIDADKAIVVTASAYYYANNSATYYYHVDPNLTEHTISKASMTNGGVTVKIDDDVVSMAAQGATITLLVAPSTNYHLLTISVTDAEEGSVALTTVTAGEEYTFTMPAMDVTVSATFEENAYATVTFAKGDEAASGTIPTSFKKYVGQTATMPTNPFTLSNNSFAGWKYGANTYNEGAGYTIQAEDAAIGGKTITFVAQWEPYPWMGSGKWELVTNANSLAANEFVIIASSTNEKALGAKNSNYRDAVDITRNTDKSTITAVGNATILQLKAGTVDNSFAFLDVDANKYLATSSSSSNDMGVSATIVANASWTITIDGKNVATVVANGNYTRNNLRANDNPHRFSCYASTSNLAKVMLYRFVAGKYYNINYAKGVEEAEEANVTNMPETQVTEGNGTATLSDKTPSYVGYTFLGWKDQDNNEYQPSDAVTLTKDVTLTAQWEEALAKSVTYTIEGADGGQIAPTMEDQVPGAEFPVADGVEKTGYDFKGWTFKGKLYKAGEMFTMPAENVKFVARWKKLDIEKLSLITDSSQLLDGTKVVIACKSPVSNNVAKDPAVAGALQENKYLKSITSDVTFNNDNTLTYTSGDVIELTLESVTGGWALRNGENYLSPVGTQNQVKWGNTPFAWSISIVDGNAIIQQGDFAIKYNASSGTERFSQYSTDQNDIQLYADMTVISNSTTAALVGYVDGDVIVLGNNVTLTVDQDIAPTTLIVPKGAQTSVIEDKTLNVNTLLVERGGTLDINDEATVNVDETFVVYSTLGKGAGTTSDGNAPGSCSQIKGADRITASGDVFMEIELTQDAKASAGWYTFSVPFKVDALNGVYYGNTKLTNEVGYAIMSYHGDLRAKGEYGWKKFRDIMKPGVLYAITVGNTDYKTLRFKKVAGEALVASSNVAVDQYTSQTEDPKDGGWNGIGNPNLQISNLKTTVPTMQFYDHKKNSFIGRDHSVNLVIGSAFFIQYGSTGIVEIEKEIKEGNGYLAPSRERKAAEETIYKVELTNVTTGELEDNVFFTAREEATNSYEIGRDVAKMSMGTAKCAQMWVPAYGTQLCAADFPLVNDKASYPIEITAPAAGEYAISTPAKADADIYLTYNGMIFWNLSMNECTLDLEKGNNTGYGLLLVKKAPSVATGVENGEVLNGENGVQKVIIDEKVYILRGGMMYGVDGKVVK